MLFDKFKSTLNEKLSKHTDEELHSLESKFRKYNEDDAAIACSQILLSRRNRPLMAKDEYESHRRGIGVSDEDFMNIIG